MLVTDRALAPYFKAFGLDSMHIVEGLCAVAVVLIGQWMARRKRAAAVDRHTAAQA
jgi:hypothetical protein